MTQSKPDIARDLKQAMSAAEFDTAAKIGARILKIHPKRTDIQIMTAVSELQGKIPENAGQRLRKLFRNIALDDPLFGAVSQNLLQYCYITNDFNSVELAIEQRLRAAPRNDLLSYMLGNLIFQREVAKSPGRCVAPKLSRALEALSVIPEHSPRFIDTQKLMARIHLHQEQYDLAFELLEKLVARHPQNIDMRMFLASSYAAAAEVEKAVSISLSIIADQPDYSAQPYMIVSFLRPQAMPETAADFLDAILEKTGITLKDAYNAAFARAKIEEAQGNMKEAFNYYQKGHAANRKARPIDMAQEIDELAGLASMARDADATRDQVPAVDISGNVSGPKPIFIVGMPRSGTTLSERILGAHPDVYAAGEIGDFAKAVTDIVGAGKISDQLVRMDAKAARAIRKQYLDALKDYAPDKRFVTNKTPANFVRVEMIRRVFPDAPILHTHRHPLATCLSIYTTPFAIPMRFADDLGELADYYQAYVQLMDAFFETDQNGMLYDLSYEDLVADPEAVAKDYLAHCGLDWHPECLEFYRADKAAATASMIQVRRPIFKDSLGKWQRFEPYIGPLAKLAENSENTKVKSAQKSSRKAVAA
ncbi:MAG: sulfotransferase [Thalassospira sp.]|uniref:tetratricopeptide repeat-containing sulfotransferase family protein n=1 Tax=Thalassospira sp. TaxID=1912094 RepID=UPI0032EB4ED5